MFEFDMCVEIASATSTWVIFYSAVITCGFNFFPPKLRLVKWFQMFDFPLPAFWVRVEGVEVRAAQSDFVPGSAFSAAKLCLLDEQQARRVSYPLKSFVWTEARLSSKLWISQKFQTLVRILKKPFLVRNFDQPVKRCETVKNSAGLKPFGGWKL